MLNNDILPAVLALIGLFLVVANIQAIQENLVNIGFWLGAVLVIFAVKINR